MDDTRLTDPPPQMLTPTPPSPALGVTPLAAVPEGTSPLEVGIYQLADDSMFRKNRIDGTGWDWSWADFRRDWMEESTNKFAYRCLPLTIANQTGWFVHNPVGFTVTWTGRRGPGSMQFLFDSSPQLWTQWINNQFGEGVITWNTPFLFRTRPIGSRLLVCGPANQFKANVGPLMAIIESDWISMSFTMNYKVTVPGVPVRFDMGEPLFQVIPLANNICADLSGAKVTYQRLADDPEIQASYIDWHKSRQAFHQKKARNEVAGDEWQKDYFQGKDASGQKASEQHTTKVKPPTIYYRQRPI